MSVLDAGFDADGEVGGAVEDGERGAGVILGVDGRAVALPGELFEALLARWASGDGFEVFGVAARFLAGGVKGVPGCEVGDGDADRDRGPEFGGLARHDEAHVAPTGGAGEVDAIGVDAGVVHREGDCVDDVLAGEGGGAGVGVGVGSPEIGHEEGPASATGLGEYLVGGVALGVVGGPGVEPDKERRGRSALRREPAGGLGGAIQRAGDLDGDRVAGASGSGHADKSQQRGEPTAERAEHQSSLSASVRRPWVSRMKPRSVRKRVRKETPFSVLSARRRRVPMVAASASKARRWTINSRCSGMPR